MLGLLCAGLIIILRGGVRFEHSRRSKLLSFDAAGANFLCSKGKGRPGLGKLRRFSGSCRRWWTLRGLSWQAQWKTTVA